LQPKLLSGVTCTCCNFRISFNVLYKPGSPSVVGKAKISERKSIISCALSVATNQRCYCVVVSDIDLFLINTVSVTFLNVIISLSLRKYILPGCDLSFLSFRFAFRLSFYPHFCFPVFTNFT
jgi:hypothetical protein